MSKITLNKIEFYITNVCNLTCSGCNRYNNYKFSGWENWADYAEIYARWAEKLDIVQPVILGGEPLLNPSINDWIKGINNLWPTRQIQIQSNGTRLDLVPDLYDTCRRHRAWIGISLHSDEHKEVLFQRIRNFLKAPIKEMQNPNHPAGSVWQFVDINSRWIHVWKNDRFVQNNIIDTPDGSVTVYRSDPLKAHSKCTFAQHKNYHFIDGKIYKCGPVALMPMFDKQYPFKISEADRELMYAYRPLTIDEFDDRAEEFFRDIDNPIPQCKFCPENYKDRPITFTKLKPNKI